MVGSDFKFFWINIPFYKMGVSFYLGYRYLNDNRTETISMKNGMYEQVVNYNTDLHFIDWDISIIPFQFTFTDIPVNIETHIGFGITRRIETPDEDELKPEIYDELKKSSTHPYFPKIGFKIGYIF